MVKSRIHSSVATLEAYKSESRVDTNCYKYKRNTIGVLLEWFVTTRTAATTSRVSCFRAVFLTFPNVCLLFSQRWKKISTNGYHHCKLHPKEKLSLEYKWNRTKLRYWKFVANEMCTAEIGEVSSVKNLFWANHASKKARISLKRNIFGWNNVPEKMNWLKPAILENWGRNG